jgi:hypothetical protein
MSGTGKRQVTGGNGRGPSGGNVLIVNDAWLSFARENAAPGLTAQAVLDQPLWRFIADPETTYLLLIHHLSFDEEGTVTKVRGHKIRPKFALIEQQKIRRQGLL